MYHAPAERFHLLDEPSAASVSLLTSSLRDDSAKGLVSPKMYAHRSRVIRQQSILSKLRIGDSPDTIDEGKRQAKRMRKAARPEDHREEGGQG